MAGDRAARPRPPGFDPLALAPPQAAKRYRKPAERAHRQPLSAIKLMCLECCCWDHTEAKRCEIRSCPLWAQNRRVFGRAKHPARGAPTG